MFEELKGLVDVVQGQLVSDELVQLQLSLHVVVHQARHVVHAPPACTAQQLSYLLDV